MTDQAARRFSDCRRFLTFKVNDQVFGVPISTVLEVCRLSNMSKMPGAPKYILGMMELRDTVVLITSLRLKLELTPAPNTRQGCVILFENGKSSFGVLVDSVNGVVTLKPDQISNPSLGLGSEQNMDFIIGLGRSERQLIILVDMHMMFSNESTIIGFDAEAIKKGAGPLVLEDVK